MAVVGSAEITVRAITLQVKNDIQKAFADARPAISAAGADHGKAYLDGFSTGIADKVPKSIEQAMGRTNARTPGKDKGGEFAQSFSGAVTSGVNLDRVLKNINVAGVGESAGRTISDGVEKEVSKVVPNVEKTLSDAGNRGGNGFIGGLKNTKIGDWFQKEIVNGAKDAADSYKVLLASGQALGAGIGVLVQGLSSVVSGLFSVASAVAPAVGALGALPGVMLAAAQAGLVLKLAFSGVAKAISAGMAPAAPAVQKSAAASLAAAKAIRNAQQGIADAHVNAAKAIEAAEQRITDAQRTSARAVADAKDGLKTAYSDAAQAAAAAADSVAKAERDVGDAQRGTLVAQLALTDARKAGAESLQQLGFSAEGAALAEQHAGLSLQDALVKLKAVQNLPPDNRARVDAELAFKDAELGYREAKDNASDLKTENDKAAKAGVDGTKEVVDAKNNVTDAQQKEKDAEAALAKARQDQAQTAIDNSNKIMKAQQTLTRAQIDGARNIAEAERNASQVRADSARNIAKAQQALADAIASSKTSTNQASAASKAYAAALANLSPAARTFVKYLVSLKSNFKDLKQAAGEDLFPKLQKAMEPIVSKLFPVLIPLLKTTGGLLGDVALKISGVVTSSSGLKLIEKFFKNNNAIIKIGGGVLADLVKIFLLVSTAVAPLTKNFAKFVLGLTDGWKKSLQTKDGMKKLTDFFTEGGKVANKLFGIFKQLWGIISTLGGASKGAGNDLLKSFSGALTNLQKILDAAKKDGSLKKFFTVAGDNAKIIFSILGSIGAYLLKLGGDPKTGDAFKSIQAAGPYFKIIFDQIKVAEPAFAHLIGTVAKVFAAFTAGDSASTLFKTLGDVAGVLVKIFGSDLVQAILKAAAPTLGVLHAISLMLIGALLLTKIFVGMSLPFVKLGSLIVGIGKSIKNLGLVGAVKAVPGALLGKINPKKDDAAPKGADAFGSNLEKLAGQFASTGKAKDIFIGNLKELSAEFGRVGKAATGIDPSTKGKLKKGSAASTAGPVGGDIEEKVVLNYPKPAAVNEQMKLIGAEISSGLAEGIKSPTPIQAMEAENARIIAATKEGFGIHSPSTVFLGIGRNLGEAVAQGMKETGALVKAEATSLTAGATSGAKTGVKEAGGKAAAGAGVISGSKGLETELGKSAGAFDKVGGSVGKFSGIAKVGGLAIKGLGGAMDLLGGPIGIIMLLLPILVKIFEHFYKNNPGFKKFIDTIVDAFKRFGDYLLNFRTTIFPALQKAWDAVVKALKAVWDAVGAPFVDGITQIWNGMVTGVEAVISGLQTAWGAVVGALKFVWDKVGAPFVNGIAGLWDLEVKGIKIIIGGLQSAWSAVITALKFVWDKVGAPFVGGIKTLWSNEINGIKVIIHALQTAWDAVVKALKFVWDKVGAPFIHALKTLWHDDVAGVKVIINDLKKAWDAVVAGLKYIWDKVGVPFVHAVKSLWDSDIGLIKKIIKAFQDAWATVIDKIKGYWNKYGAPFVDGVKTYWDKAVGKITGFIDNIRAGFSTTINAIKTFWTNKGQPIIDTIGKAFSSFGSGVKAIWDAIKDAPATGLRNMINNLNNWLVTPLNKLTEHFGLTIPSIPMPAGLSEGGFVDGQGGPREDNQLRRLSVGEAVIRERAVRSLGRDNVAFMNRTGTLPGPRGNVLSDAKNGVLGKIKAGKDKVEDLLKDGAGKAINSLMEGFKGFLPQGSGFIEDLLRRIFDKAQESAKSWGDDRQAEQDAANSTPTGDPNSGGSGGARGVWNALISAGMSKIHAAGVMGNMFSESGFQWNVIQGGRHSDSPNHGGTGYGLVQWTPSTKLAKMLGSRKNNLENQISVLLEQLAGKHGIYTEGRAGGMLDRAKTVAASAKAFMLGYERPKNKSVSNQNLRARRAQKYYDQYKGATTPADPGAYNPPIAGSDKGLSGKVRWQGGTFTRLFVRYLELAQTLFGHKIHVTQGGFRPSSSFSGSTHNKDALDSQVNNALIRALRAVGFASGNRTGLGNWAGHVHTVPSPSTGYGSPSARAQYRDYMRRGGINQGLRTRWGLATGGTVMATPGGINALLGEGGKNERVEPLDSQGLSVRDRAMIEMLTASREGGNTPTHIDVRVHIGDQELNNMIDMRVSARDRALAQDLMVGNKRRYRS